MMVEIAVVRMVMKTKEMTLIMVVAVGVATVMQDIGGEDDKL